MPAPPPNETSERIKRIAARIHEAAPELQRIDPEFGMKALQSHGAKKRVVWVTPGGSIGPASRTNGTVTDENGTQQRVSIFAYRVEDVVVHIFAENGEDAEAILDTLAAAIQNVVGVNNAPFPWNYNWAGDASDGTIARMPKVALSLTMKLPLSNQSLGLRRVAGFKHGHSEEPDKPHTDPH
jgi:hypothetical protein